MKIMNKYLITGMAALCMGCTFTACTHDTGFDSVSVEDRVIDTYQKAFVNAFGQPSPDQQWGFNVSSYKNLATARTRSNPGETYPATHNYANGGANCNANQWADPNEHFGGWLVPDPLTEGQKLRVQMYFQANPKLSYEDPHFRHFFVQQVYKGATDPGSNSTEVVTAADGSTYTSGNMNHLTVGQSEMHINNFNSGTCSTNSTVLTNGGDTNNGPFHSDEIMLMVNIDDTSCFGYHDSGSSNQAASPNHNDKAALVSAATIDAWAAANGNHGEPVVDKWNRSFMGFDLAIKEGDQAYEKDGSGNISYATYNQAAESPRYAWDGKNIIEIADASWNYYDAYKTIYGVGWLTTNKNFYIAADQVSMSQTISMNRADASTITEIQNAPVLKDIMVGDTYYQSVINLPRIKQLVDNGYLPVNNKSLAEWVKVGVSDGYFSDWIVTLTEAQRIPKEEVVIIVNSDADIRVIAEDLTTSDTEAIEGQTVNTDLDFNDVVFDVEWTSGGANITLQAAGGTLPLVVGTNPNTDNDWQKYEVHKLFGVATNVMVNTNHRLSVSRSAVSFTLSGSFSENASNIPVYVQKSGKWIELTAAQGAPASKIGVAPTFEWCNERQNITLKYPNFSSWVTDNNPLVWW